MPTLRDLLIVIPGISGSVLEKDGTLVWGSAGALWRGWSLSSASMTSLALGNDNPESDDLGDGVRAVSLIDMPSIVAGLLKSDGYGTLTSQLVTHFRANQPGEPKSVLDFPYDWRRDNRVSARKLKAFVAKGLSDWRNAVGGNDAKVILIAHSMGGLVARYFLDVLGGWRDCKALITLGTPFRGSLNALNCLANGYREARVLDMSEVLRTFTSMYQLLPIYEAISLPDGTWGRPGEISGIPNVDAARAQDALAFHREIESAVNANQGNKEYREKGYRLIPFVGARQPTLQSAVLKDGKLEVTANVPKIVPPDLGDGDGTVPRVSAVPIDMSNEFRETYCPERHACLHGNDGILTDIIERVLQMQSLGLTEHIRGPELSPGFSRPTLSLQIADAFQVGTPVTVRCQLNDATQDAQRLVCTIVRVDQAGSIQRHQLTRGPDEWWTVEIANLDEGLYRAEVAGASQSDRDPQPIHDVFGVGQLHRL